MIAEIVDQHDSYGIFIVGTCDGPERSLTGLHRCLLTVSQIWTLMVLPPTTIFLVANYTPIVGLLYEAKESLTNLLRMVLLPTEVSPMRMYLKM